MKRKNIFTAAGAILIVILIASGTFFFMHREPEKSQPPDTVQNNVPEAVPEGNANTGNETGRKKGAIPGFFAPDFELSNIDGTIIRLSDYKGKIVFLNFWTTWNSLCKEQFPILTEQEKIFSQRGDAAVLSINVGDDREKVRNFVDNHGIDIITLLDINQKIAEKYNITVFPTTFIIDEDGIVYDFYTTKMEADAMNDFVDRIKNRK